MMMATTHVRRGLVATVVVATACATVSWAEPSTTAPTTAPATGPASRPTTDAAAFGPPIRFVFFYGFDKDRPHREWTLADDGETWEERYQGDKVTRYKVVGRGPDPKDPGTIVRRSDGVMEVFFPDLDNPDRRLGWRMTGASGQWNTLGEVIEAD